MLAPLINTKLLSPQIRPHLVPRQHLIEKLNMSLIQGKRFTRKLTLVCAPAGYGKTTLIADWLSQDMLAIEIINSTAWLSLDEGDNDPARFLIYLITALKRVNEHIGDAAQSMLHSPQPPPSEVALTTVINDIISTDRTILLILDDYHVIQALPIHQQLGFLLKHQPPNMHLVLLTREDPPLPLAKLRARGQILEIRQDDLRFSAQECADFLQREMELELSTEEVSALERRTEGWIAGLHLVAIALGSRQGSTQKPEDLKEFIQAFTGSNRYILDYLIEEIFQQQSREIQDFLLKTSILDQLTASLCDMVTGHKDSKKILHYLEQNNVFMVPLDHAREWYRYHRLFGELLRHQLSTSKTLDIATLHQRASRWYEQNAFLPQAIRHSLAAQNWVEAARLVGLASPEIIRNGQFATLNGWLTSLPDAIVRESLELATTKGWISLMMGELETARNYADIAEGLILTDTPPQSRAPLIALNASLALTQSDVTNAIQLSQETLELTTESDVYGLRGMALNIMAQAQMFIGDIPAATKSYSEMVRHSQATGHALTAVSAFANLAHLLNQAGKRHEAVALCQRALDQCKDSHGRLLPVAGYALIPMGMMCYEANDLTAARDHLLQGLAYGEHLGPMTGIPVSGMCILAQLQQALGEAEEAIKIIAGVREMTIRYSLEFANSQIAGVEADILLKQGNLTAVGGWAEKAGFSPSDSPNHLQESDYFTYARLLLAQDQLSEVETLLGNFEHFAKGGGRQRSLITVHTLQALVQQAYGNTKQALDRLEMALHLAAPEDYRRAFLDEGQPLIDLLIRARYTTQDFVDQLLSDAQAEPGIEMPSTLGQPLIEPLSDRELRVLKLVSEGLSNREISERLIISLGTVKSHVHNIYGKLGVRGRTKAVARARELDLI